MQTHDNSPVLTFLRDHPDDVVDVAESLVGFDTQNPPGDTRDVVAWVESFFDDIGVETRRVVSDPRKPNLVATLPGATDRTLLYQGHLDTVPFDADRWTHDPLGERDGDRLYGRGATDMKGAVAAMLTVAKAYVETGTEPEATLVFALVSDEEVAGDAGLPTLLGELDGGGTFAGGDEETQTGEGETLAIDACVIGETTCERGRHSVTVADRGSIWLTLTAAGKSAHGSRPMLGTNAIRCLCNAIEDLESTLRETTFDLGPVVRAIVEESVAYYEPRFGAAAARDLFTRPSVNLGSVHGGDRVNVVPDAAEAHLDVRLTAGAPTEEFVETVRAVVAGHDDVAVADVRWSTGTYEDPDGPLANAVATVASAVTGETVYRRSATGGGDAKKLRNRGVPTVEFGLGTDTAHATDEYTTREALVGNAEVYARLPAELVANLGRGGGTFDSSDVGTLNTIIPRRSQSPEDQQ